jgi:hypothetical protein
MSKKKVYREQPEYVWTEKTERISKGKRKAGEKVAGLPSGIAIEQGYVERIDEK